MYDIIVIGKDLSSLIAALTSARNGLKTILVNEGKLEIEHRESGYAFPIDTTPLSGFGEDQAFGHLIEEFKLTPDAVALPSVLDPPLQVILNDHRVDLFHDPRRLILDMIREFPHKEREIRRYYHAISKVETLIERWIGEDHHSSLDDFRKIIRTLLRLPAAIAGRSSLLIRENQNDGAFRKVVEAQLAILSHLDCSHYPFVLSAASLLALPRRGLCDPYGRIPWLKWLCKEFADAGGILMEDCSVIRIDTNKEIIVDVEYAGSSQTLRGKKLIVSSQWEKLRLLLFHPNIFRRLLRKLDSLHPALYPFSLHLGVNSRGLPEKLAPYAVVIRNDARPLMDQNLVFLVSSRPGDTEHAPEGRQAVTATVFLKDSPLRSADPDLKRISNSIIDSLDGILPFLRENIDFVNIEKSIKLSRHSQEIACQKFRPSRGMIIGMDTLSPETPLRNVLMTGGLLKAGLGFKGEILAGLDAAFIAGKEIQRHER